jgi:hypothetical protein
MGCMQRHADGAAILPLKYEEMTRLGGYFVATLEACSRALGKGGPPSDRPRRGSCGPGMDGCPVVCVKRIEPFTKILQTLHPK